MEEEQWELKLYTAGKSVKSVTALANLKGYCEKYLANHYAIEVIDLLVQPHLAALDQIFAIPTLTRKMVIPIRHIIGDLSNEQMVLTGLNIHSAKNPL